ncbi:Peroxin-3 [Ramicandelaber brevisporus]|nr:Peroxin-3 [Ramicandelaber brevisporus]
MTVIDTVLYPVRRYRRTLLVLGGLAGGAYALGQFAKSKISEFGRSMATQRSLKENLRRRYEQNQLDCGFTVMALLADLSDELLQELDVESIAHALRSQRSAPPAAPAQQPEPQPEPQQAAATDATDTAAAATGTEPEQSQNESTPKPDSNGEAAAAVAVTENAGSNSPSSQQQQSPVQPAEPPSGSSSAAMSKAELWDALKIASIARVLTAVYCVELLSLLASVQLSIIGRHTYVDSVVQYGSSSSNESSRKLKPNVERSFLAFTWQLLNIGWRQIAKAVEDDTRQILEKVSVKQKITVVELAEYVGEIRKLVEGDFGSGHDNLLTKAMFPMTADDISNLRNETGINLDRIEDTVKLAELVDETRDVLESSDFRLVRHRCLDAAFDTLVDTISSVFPAAPVPQKPPQIPESARAFGNAEPVSETSIVEITPENEADLIKEFEEFSIPAPSLPLAQLLAHFTKEAHHVVNGHPNSYVDLATSLPETRAICAAIYASIDLYPDN